MDSASGAATEWSEPAVTAPHSSPLVTVGKLVSPASRCSDARWPGGIPVDVSGLVGLLVSPNSFARSMLSVAGAPARLIVMLMSDGPALSCLIMSDAESVVVGLRIASMTDAAVVYHQSRSLVPL